MNESIGTKLRLAREKRQLGFDEVSEATRVRAHYLKALESDDLSAIPSAAQARGFLRIYADFLGLQVSDLVPAAPPAPEAAPATAEPPTHPKAGGSTAASATVVPAPQGSLLEKARGLLRRRPAEPTKEAGIPSADHDPGAPSDAQAGLPEAPKKKATN